MSPFGKGTMFGKDWRASERRYDVEKREVAITVDDGTRLSCELFLPETDEPVPAILGTHPYNRHFQTDAPLPISTAGAPGWSESGDPNFYCRRGYAMANVHVRGTGKSEGTYRYYGPREIEDVRDVIRWLADRDWCDGNVGTFGMSYYAVEALLVAMLDPEPLKCVFAPWGMTDRYRGVAYHGGLLLKDWLSVWSNALDNLRMESYAKATMDDDEFQERVEEALRDEEIWGAEELAAALENPEDNPFMVDVLLHPLYDDFWDERSVGFENTDVPAYIGADWNDTALHLPTTFRAWEEWEGPVKMVVGTLFQPDRPLYQLQYESLRWFDHWLKGRDTKIMDEPDVRLFVPPDATWRSADEWPLPETKWTPFYFHSPAFSSDHESARGTLSEHEIFEGGGTDKFADSPLEHGALRYETPPMVEETLVCGPILLNLFASTTATEEHFIATLYDRTPDGTVREVTRGWLRGSQRKVDEEQSRPWRVHHPHDERKPLTPGEVYEFNVNVGPTARRFPKDHRIGLRIKGSDADDEDDEMERVSGQYGIRIGHIENQTASQVTVHRTDEHPSHVLLPVVEGNVMGTYMSGKRYEEAPYRRVYRPRPQRMIDMEKSME